MITTIGEAIEVRFFDSDQSTQVCIGDWVETKYGDTLRIKEYNPETDMFRFYNSDKELSGHRFISVYSESPPSDINGKMNIEYVRFGLVRFRIEDKTYEMPVTDLNKLKDIIHFWEGQYEFWKHYIQKYRHFSRTWLERVVDADYQKAKAEVMAVKVTQPFPVILSKTQPYYKVKENYAVFLGKYIDTGHVRYIDQEQTISAMQDAYEQKFGRGIELVVQYDEIVFYAEDREQVIEFGMWAYETYIKPVLEQLVQEMKITVN